MRSDPTFWIIARAAGVAAYVLLTGSIVAGLVVRSKPFSRSVKPATAVDLHKALAFLSLVALSIHGAALVADSTVEISPAALFVPGLAGYRSLWTSIGVLTGELMVVIYLSFWLRRVIGQRSWRRLHYTTYAAFAGATLHGVATGTDAGLPWAMALYLSATGAVAAATAWRILVPASIRPRPTASKEGAR